jgi:hypothetical protein
MGYNTDFEGSLKIEPPLNEAEINYLTQFSWTRHMKREQGPYFVVDDIDDAENSVGVINFNEPHTPQPSLWCNFIPTGDGTALRWNGCEKTREGFAWIKYLIDYFLKPKAKTQNVASPHFKDFTYNHICNGELIAQGEDPTDHWKIVVKNNKVSVKYGRIVYGK